MGAAGRWTDDELLRVGDAVQVDLAVRRQDGELRPYTTMWVVRVGDDLYVRSAGGPDRPWYRHARTSGTGRLHTGGIDRDVTFVDADPDIHDAVDSAYHAKYDRFAPGPVSHVTGPDPYPVTVCRVRSES